MYIDSKRLPIVTFIATKEIKKGEEVFFDYGDKFWKATDYSCKCGEVECKYLKNREPKRKRSKVDKTNDIPQNSKSKEIQAMKQKYDTKVKKLQLELNEALRVIEEQKQTILELKQQLPTKEIKVEVE